MWSNLILPNKNSCINIIYLDNLVSMINSCYTKDELYSIYQYIDIKHINSSLITEGTWSTYDTTSLIMSGVMPNNIEYRAFMECNNLCLAIKYVMNNLRNNIDLNEDILFNLHSILGHGLLDIKNCGNYRVVQNYIGRGNYMTATPSQINKLMKDLFIKVNQIDNVVMKASYFSYNFVSIHPFIDFNGRLSRLCESYILMQNGYAPIYLSEEKIPLYMQLIRDGQEAGDRVNVAYMKFIYDIELEIMQNIYSGNQI